MSNTLSVSVSFSEETVKLVLDALASEREKRLASKDRLTAEVMDKLAVLVPLILSRFGGQTEIEPFHDFQSFLQTFTAEQVEAITPHLRPEQMAVIMDMINHGKDPMEPKGEKSPEAN